MLAGRCLWEGALLVTPRAVALLQVTLLAGGRLIFAGQREALQPWLTDGLGYSYHPAEQGLVADWALDLVATGFDKPEVGLLRLSQHAFHCCLPARPRRKRRWAGALQGLFDSTMRTQSQLDQAAASFKAQVLQPPPLHPQAQQQSGRGSSSAREAPSSAGGPAAACNGPGNTLWAWLSGRSSGADGEGQPGTLSNRGGGSSASASASTSQQAAGELPSFPGALNLGRTCSNGYAQPLTPILEGSTSSSADLATGSQGGSSARRFGLPAEVGSEGGAAAACGQLLGSGSPGVPWLQQYRALLHRELLGITRNPVDVAGRMVTFVLVGRGAAGGVGGWGRGGCCLRRCMVRSQAPHQVMPDLRWRAALAVVTTYRTTSSVSMPLQLAFMAGVVYYDLPEDAASIFPRLNLLFSQLCFFM
jgi:hypothetical protein